MWDGRFTKLVVAYMVVGAVATVMTILGLFSIGPFILPLPAMMALGLLLWSRPRLVAFLVSASFGWSAAYLVILLAPWVDVEGFRQIHSLALRVSLPSALLAGTLGALVAAALTRPRNQDSRIVPTG